MNSRRGMTRRDVAGVALPSAGAALLAAAGCAGQQRAPSESIGPASLRFTFSSDEGELVHWEKIVEIARAKLPQISVTKEVYEQGTDTHFAKLLVLFASGDAPDVTQIGPQNIPTFVQKSGGLVALDDLVKRDKFDLSDFWPRAMPLSRWRQKLYTLPLGGGPNPLFYNATHFRQAGLDVPAVTDAKGTWTWETFTDTARRLAVREGDAYKRAGLLVDLNFYRISPYIWSAGGDYLNADQTKCLLAQPPAMEAIQYLVDLAHKQRVGPVAGTPAPGIRWFPEQTIAMQLQPMTSVYLWKQDPGFEFDVVANPKGKAGQVGFLNNWSCGILSPTKVKDAAWELLKQITGPESIAYYAGVGRAFPWRKTVAQSKEYRDRIPLKNLDVLWKLGDRIGKTIPYSLGWGDILKVGNSTLAEVGAGKLSVREGMERIAREADRVLVAG
ncbi:MAG: sugar ABC transporter substrate-binding protein [Chloroflexi bacterium]|nr:sugar ABC transporter substrate-binding protein [Chloroflexota bacterium]